MCFPLTGNFVFIRLFLHKFQHWRYTGNIKFSQQNTNDIDSVLQISSFEEFDYFVITLNFLSRLYLCDSNHEATYHFEKMLAPEKTFLTLTEKS